MIKILPMKTLLSIALLSLSLCVFAEDKSVYDFPLKDINSKATSLKVHKGKVMLIVNVASACGLTPQYKQLQSIYQKYGSKGFTVCGFPCNQFGRQEPGTLKEIKEFCSSKYAVTFPMYAKIEVNGEGAHPLYQTLKKEAGGSDKIGWNFEKFLVGRDGKVIKRFSPGTKPDAKEVTSAIEAGLKK
jgi:glutathione peroxidase